MKKGILFILLLLSTGLCLPEASEQPSFTVQGEVLRPLKITLEALSKFKQTEVHAKDKDDKDHLFKGVLLATILDSAGTTLGSQLRGENLAKYVLVQAADGYKVVFSLTEIDPEFSSQVILLASQVDGHLLPSGQGPFRMIVPGDKKHARWIREVTSINILFSKE